MSLAQSLANIIQNEAFQRGQLGIQAAGIIPNAIAQGADTLQGALNQIDINKTRALQRQQLARAGELQELQLSKAKRDEQNEAEIRAILKAIPDGPNATQQRAQAFVQFWQSRDPEKAMAIRNSLRGEAIQAAQLMEGKPGRTPVQAGVEAKLPATATSPVVPLEAQQVAHEPVTIPGVLGPDIQVQPSTAQELQQRKLAEKLGEAQIKGLEPYTLGANQVRFQGGTKVAAGPEIRKSNQDTKLGETITSANRKIATFRRPDGTTYEVDLGSARAPQPPASIQIAKGEDTDSWVEAINTGQAKLTDVPIASRGKVNAKILKSGNLNLPPAIREKANAVDSATALLDPIDDLVGKISRGEDVATNSVLLENYTSSVATLLSRSLGERGVATEGDVNRAKGLVAGWKAANFAPGFAEREMSLLKGILGAQKKALTTGYTQKFPSAGGGGGNAPAAPKPTGAKPKTWAELKKAREGQ